MASRLAALVLLLATPTTHALAAAKRRKPSKPKTSEPDYVDIQDGDVAWQCESVVATLKSGGVGVIPTDTGYAFCARVNEKDAVRRLLDIKGADSGKKPLALLCRDLAAIDQYTRYQSRTIFKVLKKALPGPYTFVLPASEHLPRVLLKNGKRQWKRNTVGVRVPADAVCAAILEALDGEPLFCSSVPVSEDGDQLVCHGPLDVEGSWCSLVDFVVDAGELAGAHALGVVVGDGDRVRLLQYAPLGSDTDRGGQRLLARADFNFATFLEDI